MSSSYGIHISQQPSRLPKGGSVDSSTKGPFQERFSKIGHIFPSIVSFIGEPASVARVCKFWNASITKKDNSNFCTQWCLQLAYTHGYVNNKAVDLKEMRGLLNGVYGICNVSLEFAGDVERAKIIWQQYLVEGRRLCEDSLFNELARKKSQQSSLQNRVEDEKEDESKLEPLGPQHFKWIDAFSIHHSLKAAMKDKWLQANYGQDKKAQINKIYSKMAQARKNIQYSNEYFFIRQVPGGKEFLEADGRDTDYSQVNFLESNKSKVNDWVSQKGDVRELRITDPRLTAIPIWVKEFPNVKKISLFFNQMKSLNVAELPKNLEEMVLIRLSDFTRLDGTHRTLKELFLFELPQFTGFKEGMSFPNVTQIGIKDTPKVSLSAKAIMGEHLFVLSKPTSDIRKACPQIEVLGEVFNDRTVERIYVKGDWVPEMLSWILTASVVCSFFITKGLMHAIGWPFYLYFWQGVVGLYSFVVPMMEGNRDYTRVALRSLMGLSVVFQEVLFSDLKRAALCLSLFWGTVGALYTHLKEAR